MSVRRFLWIVLVAAWGAACGGGAPSPGMPEPDMSPSGRTAMEHELGKNLQKWTRAQPSRYDYQINKICFCPYPVEYPVTVSVQDGQRTRAVASDDAVVPDSVAVLTIEELFELAKQAINGSNRVQITYDGSMGYPNRISIGKWPGNIPGENTAWTVEVVK